MASIADRLFALLWVIVGIVVVYSASDISGGGANAQDGLGPKAFPQAIGVILAGLGLWLLLSDPVARLIGRPRDGAPPAPSPAPQKDVPATYDTESLEPAPPWRVPLTILVTVAYAALLPILHYVAATLLASVAMLALLGARRLSVLIIYPLVLTFAAQYAFTTVVGVILP